MKMTVITVVVALAILTGAYGLVGAADRPHNDYRTGYSDSSCTSGAGAACHNVTNGTFMPAPGINDSSASNEFTRFCLSCHNSAGEAHGKNAGSASTNHYVNFTGIDKTTAYSGTSHSWKGIIGNAGTRVPTLIGFKTDAWGTVGAGTMHMVNWTSGGQTYYKVRCQTCHSGMYKSYASGADPGNIDWAQCTTSDYTRFTVPPGTPTKTYLNKYVQVYRNGPATITNSRAKKQYLVSPSEYTYKNLSALIVFKTAQSVGTYIYVDIHEPYLRDDNTANAVCVDCHNDRMSQSVTHASGTAYYKNGHPVSGSPSGGPNISVSYGHSYGLHTTVMPQVSSGAYVESGKVYCTSCHKQHNAASNNGELMRESTGASLCGECHKTILNGYSSNGPGSTNNIVNIHNGSKHTSNNEPATDCLDCHTTHNSNNIMLIKNVINGRKVNFQSFTGARSFGPDTGYGICEVCHTKTSHHLFSNASSGRGHNTGLNCTQCHSHASGFQPKGGCTSCHGQPPTTGNAGPKSGTYSWNDASGNLHTAHMNFIASKFPTLVGTQSNGADVRCGCCHGNRPLGSHPENTQNAYIDASSAYWQGGTISGVNLPTNYGTAAFTPGTAGYLDTTDDTCANVACHNAAETRSWNGSPGNGPYGLSCDSCHEYPGSAKEWPITNGHSVRADSDQSTSPRGTKNFLKHLNVATAYNASLDFYSSVTKNKYKCGKCHMNNPNHTNGTVVVVPNGYGAWGANFNVIVTQSKSSARCTNVGCHFNRDTPNWY